MPERRRVTDAVGAVLAGLWPIALTLATLGDPSRYDPVGLYSGLGSPVRLASRPTTNPGIYTTAYSLGVRAASLLLHGHLGWWNPFEGTGAPLIGEGQSGGLFPYSLLLPVHDGSLLFHLALEATAGVATFFLLRELRCRAVVATVGGMLFATNGTFAWLQNAAFNPVCFLPLLLLGVERSRHAAAEGRGGGWRWLAVAAAFCLAAGFVGIAAMGVAFAVFLAVQRGFAVPRERVAAYARKVVAGLAVGGAIAAPVLVAFGDFVHVGYVAAHQGNVASHAVARPYLAMSIAPYLFGKVLASVDPTVRTLWGQVGGYAGFCLGALGIAALFSRRDRALKVALAAWVAVAFAYTMGVPPFLQVVSAVPGLNHVAVARDLAPTWELALVVLACLALRDLTTRSRAHSAIAVTSGVLGAALLWLVGLAIAPDAVRLARALQGGDLHASELLILVAAALLVLAVLAPASLRAVAVGAVAVAEAGVLFCVPLLSWPPHQRVDVALERYLQVHTGTYRFAGVGVPFPNLGSALGVAQLDVADLPVPSDFVPIAKRVDPFDNPTALTGDEPALPGERTPEQLVVAEFAYLERLGVRFVVTPFRATALFPPADGVQLAFADARFDVWQLPHPTALDRAPGCEVTSPAFGSVRANCPHRSTLLVNEQYLPGWTATVNGATVDVVNRGDGFQEVALPAGRSSVTLTFLPPDETIAGIAALLGVFALLLPYGPFAARRRSRRAARMELAGMVQRYSRLGDLPPPSEVPAARPDPPTGVLVLGELGVPAVPTEPPAARGPGAGPAPAERDERTGEHSTAPVSAPEDASRYDPPTLTVEAVSPEGP